MADRKPARKTSSMSATESVAADLPEGIDSEFNRQADAENIDVPAVKAGAELGYIGNLPPHSGYDERTKANPAAGNITPADQKDAPDVEGDSK
jgi:hypothetical protein